MNDDTIKALRALAKNNAMTTATHFPDCWKFHFPCGLTLALDTIEEQSHYVPCEPCQKGHHDDCTGYCSSACCALDAYERDDTEAAEV